MRHCIRLAALVWSFGAVWRLQAQSDDGPSNEYRLTLYPYHKISGDLTGFGEFGYGYNPDDHYQRFIADWPGLTYKFNHWVQLWGGLRTTYTDNQDSPSTLELEPFIGPKLFVPNSWKWNIYNYTRFEYFDTLTPDTGQWSGTTRIRSRFGVEFPLATCARAWKPKSWYGLADVEPIYQFDNDQFNQLTVRGGVGYVVSDRIRVEFIYYAQFTRSNGSPLEYDKNIFRLNLKIGLSQGILGRIFERNDSN